MNKSYLNDSDNLWPKRNYGKSQINHQLHHFYKTLFTEKIQIQNENITAYLNQISIPVLTEQSNMGRSKIGKRTSKRFTKCPK